eukprot:c20894_g3_i1.p1 GENE.c20894_g3_i1~~c20894_g3_i1.p1  ORF type:complete len:268 (-),score=120.63 c20894_g3_i1:74-877(-)
MDQTSNIFSRIRAIGQGVQRANVVYPSSDSSDSSEEDISWINWFCSRSGNEAFVEVPESFIKDEFNLTGLASEVPYYDHALDTILDLASASDEEDIDTSPDMLENAAIMLYGLIHARYIISVDGMAAMKERFESSDFGKCPRLLCEGFPLLPVGVSDIPCTNTMKFFCARCIDVYLPKSKNFENIDGAYFGTSFPHLFFQNFPELRPPPISQSYTQRIYGFKVHQTLPKRSVSDGRDYSSSSSSLKTTKSSSSSKSSTTTKNSQEKK